MLGLLRGWDSLLRIEWLITKCAFNWIEYQTIETHPTNKQTNKITNKPSAI